MEDMKFIFFILILAIAIWSANAGHPSNITNITEKIDENIINRTSTLEIAQIHEYDESRHSSKKIKRKSCLKRFQKCQRKARPGKKKGSKSQGPGQPKDLKCKIQDTCNTEDKNVKCIETCQPKDVECKSESLCKKCQYAMGHFYARIGYPQRLMLPCEIKSELDKILGRCNEPLLQRSSDISVKLSNGDHPTLVCTRPDLRICRTQATLCGDCKYALGYLNEKFGIDRECLYTGLNKVRYLLILLCNQHENDWSPELFEENDWRSPVLFQGIDGCQRFVEENSESIKELFSDGVRREVVCETLGFCQ